MKRFIFRFGVSLLTLTLGIWAFIGWEQLKGSSFSDELMLNLVSDRPVLRVDEAPSIKLYITNRGKDTVTLVHPGDGSESSLRTPVLRWWVHQVVAGIDQPMDSEFYRVSRCGNINSLRWDEVFRLAPGEIKEMEAWMPRFRKPGTYKVTFFYDNLPWMKWSGFQHGLQNPIAMWRVKHSTETSLRSNEIFLTVRE